MGVDIDDPKLELGEKPNTLRFEEGPRANLQEVSPGLAFHDASVPDAQGHSIPIGFRTLSIQVTESLHQPGKIKDDMVNFFETLTFHTVSVQSLCQMFGVNPERGLEKVVAARHLQRDGPNAFVNKRPQYIWKFLNYMFGGFCSILWGGVIVFLLCWRPLSNPPAVPNLALAIVVIIVILFQALFSGFQDWSTTRVMNSILNLLPSECVVIREGETVRIGTRDLVVGDVVLLSVGNKVPASDVRARLCDKARDRPWKAQSM